MNWEDHKGHWPHANASRFILSEPHKWHIQDYGNGPTLLFIHGAGGSAHSWNRTGSILAKNYRIVVVDLPGQGFTKLGAPNRCGLDEMSEDLHHLLRANNIQPNAIIGHSAGGVIALRLAELLPQSPPVIGINAALSNFKGPAGFFFPLFAKTLAVLPLVASIFTASSANPKSVKRLIDGTGSKLEPDDLRYYQDLIGSSSHVNATLSMMAQWKLDPLLSRLPEHWSHCLFIVGANDRAVPPKTSRDAAVRMPQARVVSLPDLGHLAHEEEPQMIVDCITNFLGEDLS